MSSDYGFTFAVMTSAGSSVSSSCFCAKDSKRIDFLQKSRQHYICCSAFIPNNNGTRKFGMIKKSSIYFFYAIIIGQVILPVILSSRSSAALTLKMDGLTDTSFCLVISFNVSWFIKELTAPESISSLKLILPIFTSINGRLSFVCTSFMRFKSSLEVSGSGSTFGINAGREAKCEYVFSGTSDWLVVGSVFNVVSFVCLPANFHYHQPFGP